MPGWLMDRPEGFHYWYDVLLRYAWEMLTLKY